MFKKVGDDVLLAYHALKDTAVPNSWYTLVGANQQDVQEAHKAACSQENAMLTMLGVCKMLDPLGVTYETPQEALARSVDSSFGISRNCDKAEVIVKGRADRVQNLWGPRLRKGDRLLLVIGRVNQDGPIVIRTAVNVWPQGSYRVVLFGTVLRDFDCGALVDPLLNYYDGKTDLNNSVEIEKIARHRPPLIGVDVNIRELTFILPP